MATNNFYMNHKTSTTNSYSSNRKQCVYDTKINILPRFLMRMNPVCVATTLLLDMSGETYANSNKQLVIQSQDKFNKPVYSKACRTLQFMLFHQLAMSQIQQLAWKLLSYSTQYHVNGAYRFYSFIYNIGLLSIALHFPR